jgi:TolB-like protein
MKRCPQCRRDYFDDTLRFCLEDGSALIQGIGGMHSTEAPSFDSPTMIHSTAAPDSIWPTSLLPANANPATNENAIAVLPFANMSRDEDAEYLSDGLAEELLNVLSRINGLRVAGRTSAFSFKGKQTTFAEIGQQLGVSSVLEGSVRTAGKRVRISVQLVNVSDGYHLWSQSYDRTMDDIFAIQDDIAASVVE